MSDPIRLTLRLALALLAWLRPGFELSAATPLLASSMALLAVRVLLQRALAPSYAERGLAFWLSPLADPLAALRICISTLRRPKSWRGRKYSTMHELPL